MTPDPVLVLSIGTKAFMTISHDKVTPVTVTAIQLMGQGTPAIKYEVVWFDGLTRRCEWVEACEIVNTEGKPKLKIGFKAP